MHTLLSVSYTHLDVYKRQRALRLWGVSPSAMRLAINRLVASKAFAKSGARQYQAFKRAVPLLLEYAKTMDGVVEEAASAGPELSLIHISKC